MSPGSSTALNACLTTFSPKRGKSPRIFGPMSNTGTLEVFPSPGISGVGITDVFREETLEGGEVWKTDAEAEDEEDTSDAVE